MLVDTSGEGSRWQSQYTTPIGTADLRTIVAQGRKRIGFLIGAGAAAGLPSPGGVGPLIPAVDGLTVEVLKALEPQYAAVIAALRARLPSANVETILSRVRTLAGVIGDGVIDGLDGEGYSDLGRSVCADIGRLVDVPLPTGENPYRHLVNWITGADRNHPVEIFTTNYDLLLERAFESVRAPTTRSAAGADRVRPQHAVCGSGSPVG